MLTLPWPTSTFLLPSGALNTILRFLAILALLLYIAHQIRSIAASLPAMKLAGANLYEVRLGTFKTESWSRFHPAPEVLAEAGFYCTRAVVTNLLSTTCYDCGVFISIWSETDDPWVRHYKLSPFCRHVSAEALEDRTCRRCHRVFPSSSVVLHHFQEAHKAETQKVLESHFVTIEAGAGDTVSPRNAISQDLERKHSVSPVPWPLGPRWGGSARPEVDENITDRSASEWQATPSPLPKKEEKHTSKGSFGFWGTAPSPAVKKEYDSATEWSYNPNDRKRPQQQGLNGPTHAPRDTPWGRFEGRSMDHVPWATEKQPQMRHFAPVVKVEETAAHNESSIAWPTSTRLNRSPFPDAEGNSRAKPIQLSSTTNSPEEEYDDWDPQTPPAPAARGAGTTSDLISLDTVSTERVCGCPMAISPVMVVAEIEPGAAAAAADGKQQHQGFTIISGSQLQDLRFYARHITEIAREIEQAELASGNKKAL
ncbi:hypothetical protein NKR23_g4294 [Pleurostoma richardsiae]|uniref:C2H2-type domain-containing protein n=1 Tax=Pleurostoma richardsiae TaxID=41990 RepID=A0AA38VV92_9PEZI|nr:hypothetical protein NKR23_g4294 [Pleurostoma richardsiae]